MTGPITAMPSDAWYPARPWIEWRHGSEMECQVYDLDKDGDVDLMDWATIERVGR